MATVKKNNKKKVIIPICIVLVIAIAATSIVAVAKANSGTEISLATISSGDIYETVSLTGEVTAGTTKEYKVGSVATVKEVFVKVGDEVEKDDVLATFDVTQLDSQISSLQSSYNKSLSSYNDSLALYNSSKKKADKLKKDIASLEKRIAKLEKEEQAKFTTAKKTTITKKETTAKAPTTQRTTTKRTTTNIDVSDVTIPSIPSVPSVPSVPSSVTMPTTKAPESTSAPTPEETIAILMEQMAQLNETLAKITDDMETLAKTSEIIADTIAELTSKGITDSAVIAEAVGEAVRQAINEGVIDAANLLIESDIAVDMIETAVASIDFQGITDTVVNSNNVTLASSQVQLAAAYAQYAVYSAQANDTFLETQKSTLDTSKKVLDALKTQKAEMEGGWRAAFDGTITAVDITAGEQTSLISTGITLENLSSMTATVSLSEYDVHKVTVGMPATITTAYGTYEGEVVSIAPTASGGSSGSLLDSVGSMAGISGLSSLTDKGAGVECQVSIKDTDENIIVGFDANVEIHTGEYLGVTIVPIESVKLEKSGTYVYLYNAEDSTVTKTLVETGATCDSGYEVKAGLNVGDQIISAPESTYEEDTFKVKVVTK